MYLTNTLRRQAASFFSEDTKKVYFLQAARNNAAKQGHAMDGMFRGNFWGSKVEGALLSNVRRCNLKNRPPTQKELR